MYMCVQVLTEAGDVYFPGGRDRGSCKRLGMVLGAKLESSGRTASVVLFLSYVHQCFVYMFIWAADVCPVPMEARRGVRSPGT